MMQSLYDRLALPKDAYVGKRLYKTLFYENVPFRAADRRAFTQDVTRITWQYMLKPDTVPVAAYVDAEREYVEVGVLQVDLTEPSRVARLAELVHRAIPYPLLVVFTKSSTAARGVKYLDGKGPRFAALSFASKRFHQSQPDVVVADEFFMTPWFDVSQPTPMQQRFLDSMAIEQLPHTHLYDFYKAWIDRVLALQWADISGEYKVPDSAKQGALVRERLTDYRAVEKQIAHLRAEMKKETQFNRQVELNVQIKSLEERLRKLTS